MKKREIITTMNEHLRSARIFRNENRYTEAIMELESALELCEVFKIHGKKSQTLSYLANIYHDLGNLERSLASYMDALSIAESNAESDQIADIIRHIADVECEIGDLKASMSHYQRALSYYRSGIDKYGINTANAIRGFAILKEKMLDYSGALQLWKEAKSIYEKFKIEEGIQECLKRIKKLDIA